MNILRQRLCFVAAILFGANGAEISSAGDSLVDRFWTEYPSAARRLEESYRNIRLRGTRTELGRTYSWEFAQRGDKVSYATTSPVSGGRHVIVLTPELTFRLISDSGSEPLRVISMGSAPPEAYKQVDKSIRHAALAAAPYCVFGTRIADLIAEKSFRVISAHEVDGPGGKLLRVDWVSPPRPGNERKGWYVFSPQEGWILREAAFLGRVLNARTNQWEAGSTYFSVTYEPPVDGILLPHRLTIHSARHNDPNSPERHLAETNEVNESQIGPPPERLFTLQAYGIRIDPTPEAMPIALVLLALAGGLALMAIGLRVARSRLRKATPLAGQHPAHHST